MLTQAQKEKVLRFVRSFTGASFTFRDVVRLLDLDSNDRRSLQRYLDELDSQEIIHRIKRGKYARASRESLVSGVLSRHRDGYGFVSPEDRSIYKGDIFVPARNMEEALHGDRVLLKVTRRSRPRRGGHGSPPGGGSTSRIEGSVIRILDRGHTAVVGRFYDHPRLPFVLPLDPRVTHEIRISPHATAAAKNGQIVAVTLSEPLGRDQAHGSIARVLGYPGEKDIEYRIVEHKFALAVEFTPETIREAEAIPDRITEGDIAGREDFRDDPSVTIDGETALDFDDAISLRRLPSGGFSLGVHIADVSHYVREGTALDREAYARGTSVYFPARAIPMLPPKLSTGICSLNPGVDRLVFSVLMEVDGRGRVVERRFAKGVLRSRARMTFEEVAGLLRGDDPDLRNPCPEILPLLKTARELCQILAEKRYRRGALDFDLPETDIRFDRHGKVMRVIPAQRTIAHQIVEEFMILANETVAEELVRSAAPALYRVHEKPDPGKVREFAKFALVLGYRLQSRRSQHHARDYQRFIHQLQDKPEARLLTYLMLRSFMQAHYSEKNTGHFGLAAEQYTHFTSPIRRYPDLVVHRLLKDRLAEKPSRAWQDRMVQQLPQIARHTSCRERSADSAEREIERIKKVQFMADKVGREFDGIVFLVNPMGFFVELLDPFVEGFVPLSTLIDDDFRYREKSRSIVGKRTRRHFRLGTKVRLRLDRADQETYRLSFSVLGERTRQSPSIRAGS